LAFVEAACSICELVMRVHAASLLLMVVNMVMIDDSVSKLGVRQGSWYLMVGCKVVNRKRVATKDKRQTQKPKRKTPTPMTK